MKTGAVIFFLALLFLNPAGDQGSTRSETGISADPTGSLISPAREQPDLFSFFTPEEIARAKSYQKSRLVIILNRTLLVVAFLLFLLLSRASLFFESVCHRLSGGKYFLKLTYLFICLSIMVWTLFFPLDYQRFRLEQTFGFIPLSLASWLLLVFKSRFISLVLFLLVIIVSYRLILWNQSRWWIPAGMIVSLLIFILVFLAPVLIDPLLAKFEPLESPELKARIIRLVSRSGLEKPQILVRDSHHRTTKANAYFSGLGKTKRIVLFDNLVDHFPPPEIESILAHELGHYRKQHILKGGLTAAALAFLFLFILARVLHWSRKVKRLGITNVWDVSSLPLMLLTLILLLNLTLPLQNWISRSFEREADLYSLNLTQNPEAFIAAQVRLARRNLSDPLPHPLVSAVFYTHPPTMERIRRTAEWKGAKTNLK